LIRGDARPGDGEPPWVGLAICGLPVAFVKFDEVAELYDDARTRIVERVPSGTIETST
jgi:hypothetical protein